MAEMRAGAEPAMLSLTCWLTVIFKQGLLELAKSFRTTTQLFAVDSTVGYYRLFEFFCLAENRWTSRLALQVKVNFGAGVVASVKLIRWLNLRQVTFWDGRGHLLLFIQWDEI